MRLGRSCSRLRAPGVGIPVPVPGFGLPRVQSCSLPRVRRGKAEPAEQEARAAKGAAPAPRDDNGVLPSSSPLPSPPLLLAPCRPCSARAHKTFMAQLCHTCLRVFWQKICCMPRSLSTATASILLQHVTVT